MASLVAVALGGVAVGAFWLARPTKPIPSLRLFQQWVPIDRAGPDGDAAVAFRVGAAALQRQAAEDGLSVEFRVIDRAGKGYPLVPMADSADAGTLKLQRGYPFPLSAPRLAAFVGETMRASVALESVPNPLDARLMPSTRPRLRLVFRAGGGLFAEPVGAMPRDERWGIRARRTRYNAHPEAIAELSPNRDRFASRRLDFPFAREAGAVEVEVTRFRMLPRPETLEIPGLRLARRFGGTALLVDREVRLTTRTGAQIWVPRQYNGPRHPLRHRDPRSANLDVRIVPPAESSPAGRPGWRGRFELLGPRPEALGLRELRVGGGTIRETADSTGPSREGVFTARVRLTSFRAVPIERFVTVVAVEQGPNWTGPRIR